MKGTTAAIKAIILAIFVVGAMPSYGADFGKVYWGTIKPHEGGYSISRSDPGNWSGGSVGKGVLAGTNKGIAANTYYAEVKKKGWSFKTLTDQQAMFFYRRDFWGHLGELKSQGIAEEMCDETVNMGPGGGPNLLKKVFPAVEWAMRKRIPAFTIPVSPQYTAATMAWINSFTEDRVQRLLFYDELRKHRTKFYVNLAIKKPSMRPYLLSWMERTVD